MAYGSEDVAWLLTEWRTSASHGAEYMTWRQLVNRYPGKSDLDWLWGLVDAAVDDGYLAMTPEGKPSPEPDHKSASAEPVRVAASTGSAPRAAVYGS